MVSAASDGRMPLRIITGSAICDGHDAAINIFRRILQSQGCEVIHLGHNRGADEFAHAAIQEDAHAIAITSYQGGAVGQFTHTRSILDEHGFDHVLLFGGGGGTILPHEIKHLRDSSIARIYSPDDGREMGLVGMVQDAMGHAYEVDLLEGSRFEFDGPVTADDHGAVARLLTMAENGDEGALSAALATARSRDEGDECPVVGITGTGGAGKSCLLDEIMHRIQRDNPGAKVALLATDPTREKTGGALLGDRIRMNSLTNNPSLFMRSFASRSSGSEIAECVGSAIGVCKAVGFDLVLVETSGIGQRDSGIAEVSDISLYVTTMEYGAPSQLEKLAALDIADMVVLNKFDRPGAEDALRDIRKQYQRNHELFDSPPDSMPVYPTIASQFADAGVDQVWAKLAEMLNERHGTGFAAAESDLGSDGLPERQLLIPHARNNYLAEVSLAVREYHARSEAVAGKVRLVQQLEASAAQMRGGGNEDAAADLEAEAAKVRKEVPDEAWRALERFEETADAYSSGETSYLSRGKEIKVRTTTKTFSGTEIPRVSLPTTEDWGERLKWIRKEGVPGVFPFTGGVFPFKRADEMPLRMFAGEGSAETTNRRFHYLAKDQPFNRLSTAFDSVTLYGLDATDERLDLFSKICESGVSISNVDEMERLFEGFDLCAPNTSVSLTINGPYWTILAFYFETAIRQQLKLFAEENGREPSDEEAAEIRARTLSTVRGTVQADQLKEVVGGQNTTLFNLNNTLRMMTDVTEYYVENGIRNHYFVSISGYHIDEAGANPITQAALTLSHGFAYLEMFKARGLDPEVFLRNISFFLSLSMQPEYSVLGRVCRRIWAVALRDVYGIEDERNLRLKYHVQGSGRSLHAQDQSYNDLRSILQALYALQDNANSLHTNSRDEAYGTPTEETVRDAVAMQLILNKEYGTLVSENPLQGSFFTEGLTDSVEEQILSILDEMSSRGGVLGSIETGYQRGRIQQENVIYEMQKNSGEMPIVGVNTFVDEDASRLSADTADEFDIAVTRSDDAERQMVVDRNRAFKEAHAAESTECLERLRRVAEEGGNIFECIMDICPHCTLGQITETLMQCVGQFRRDL
ncbi:methylmalonyl-CoA mutase family protein [Candidatus Thalassarchaeum betae]|uniref:methylmalonyl-CoA mutase family protein n=1 Tax=Candidatus Thalassarchaeum betae TaxID=2599289 RepID=UPI0030C748FA|nr:methylmalonyl-CoA mutase family protein [Candidatus Thalassoarchaea betae]